ncbi:hypothetical protein [Microbacterium sp. 18062]|nr:hypothetical protein [Microbacterium sp. 18062]
MSSRSVRAAVIDEPGSPFVVRDIVVGDSAGVVVPITDRCWL